MKTPQPHPGKAGAKQQIEATERNPDVLQHWPRHPHGARLGWHQGQSTAAGVSKETSADLLLSRLLTFPAGVTQLSPAPGRVLACRDELPAPLLPPVLLTPVLTVGGRCWDWELHPPHCSGCTWWHQTQGWI